MAKLSLSKEAKYSWRRLRKCGREKLQIQCIQHFLKESKFSKIYLWTTLFLFWMLSPKESYLYFVFVPFSDQTNGKNNLWEVSQLLKSPYNHCHLPRPCYGSITLSCTLILPTTAEHRSLFVRRWWWWRWWWWGGWWGVGVNLTSQ